jgi:hypothetical protein
VRLWDRKTDGGFPETKELKRRVRDVIQPGRDLGHVDRDYSKGGGGGQGQGQSQSQGEGEGGAATGGKDGVKKGGEEVVAGSGGEDGQVKEGVEGKVCSDGKCEDCE